MNSDDMVICDCCHISVHEGCYGVDDVTSAYSTDSNNSTEPWFCETCKAGVVKPVRSFIICVISLKRKVYIHRNILGSLLSL